MAAADRAVSKAELAADKRFEALNELRQMLTEMVGNLVPKSEAEQRFNALAEKIDGNAKRIDELNSRFNVLAGETTGNRRNRDDNKAQIAIGISIVGMLITLALFFMKVFTP